MNQLNKLYWSQVFIWLCFCITCLLIQSFSFHCFQIMSSTTKPLLKSIRRLWLLSSVPPWRGSMVCCFSLFCPSRVIHKIPVLYNFQMLREYVSLRLTLLITKCYDLFQAHLRNLFGTLWCHGHCWSRTFIAQQTYMDHVIFIKYDRWCTSGMLTPW